MNYQTAILVCVEHNKKEGWAAIMRPPENIVLQRL